MFEKKSSFIKQIGKVILVVSAFCIISSYSSIAQFAKGNHLLSISSVVINEFMAKNNSYIRDQDGKFDDWIELYNLSSEPVDISGYYLSDKADRPDKYQIPEGTIIQGHGYLIIWADDDGDQEGLHANFKLSADGEELRMYEPDLTMIQEVIFGPQEADMSYSRIPNGDGNFIIKEPTFGENNESTSSVDNDLKNTNEIRIYPNPTTAHVFISAERNISDEIEIMNVNGSSLKKMPFSGEATINIENYPPGVYFVRVGDVISKFIIRK